MQAVQEATIYQHSFRFKNRNTIHRKQNLMQNISYKRFFNLSVEIQAMFHWYSLLAAIVTQGAYL
jgi:hypothetical protein